MPILEEGSEKSRRLCTYCNIVRPTRYKHCHRCNCCVIGHDHHCPLTGTCIGQRNYFFFILFLVAINSLLIISSVVSIYLICSQPGSAAKRIKSEPGLTFIAIWSSSFLILFQLLYLLLFHIYLIIEGKTTYEYYKGKNHFDKDDEKTLRHFASIPSLLFESKFGESNKSLGDALTPDEYYIYYDMDAPQPQCTPTNSLTPYSSANSSGDLEQGDDDDSNSLEQGDSDSDIINNYNSNNNNNSRSNSNSASLSAYLDGGSVHSDVDVQKSPIFQLSPVPSPSTSPRTLSNNKL